MLSLLYFTTILCAITSVSSAHINARSPINAHHALNRRSTVQKRCRQRPSNSSSSSSLVSAAWYAGWHSDDFPVSNVSWSKYTHMMYAFAETTTDVTKLDLSGSNPDVIPNFVSEAKKNNVKALITVGGWTGSRYFSTAVSTASNRAKFVKTITNLVSTYNLDGIDFDWEYPGTQGIGCNVESGDDTTNFLTFLQLLRQDPVGSKLILSAATSVFPWAGSDGNQLADVSGFAKVFDFISIMNYDETGSWINYVGPNAALDDTCAPSANQQGSAVRGVAAWSKAGMPANQIVLGVPAYGHGFVVPTANAFTSGSQNLASYPVYTSIATGDKWDDAAGVDECGNQSPAGGNFDFWGLVDAGFLNQDGSVASGIFSRFDSCSQTPYVYNKQSQVMVSYDNAQSFKAKGAWIKQQGLKGFAIWEAGGDYHDILLDSIRSAAGA